MVGKDRGYYASVTSAIGKYPAVSGNVVEIVARAVSGTDYSKKIRMTQSKPVPAWSVVAAPDDAEPDLFLQAEFTAPKKLLNGAIRFDDVRLDAQLYQADYDGSIDFYFADSANYTAASAGSPFSAVGLLPDSLEGSGWLGLPAEQKWYAVFGNEQNSRNVELLSAKVQLFARATAITGQNLACTANWNWIALNVAPLSPAVTDVLAPLGDNGLKIRSLQGEAVYEAGKGWSGSLTNLESGRGYLLQLAAGQSFSVKAPAIPVSLPVNLNQGWNWVAYLPFTALPVEQALAPIANQLYQIKGQQRSAMFVEGRWIGDLTELEPGQMYKISMTAPATLTWPNPQPALGKESTSPDWGAVIPGTAGNMVVIAHILSSHTFGMAIVVDDQGNRRGFGVPIAGTDLHYFTIVGDVENDLLSVELRVSPTGYQTNCLQRITFRDNATLGSLTSPLYLSDFDLTFQLAQNHPNPFNSGTTISYTLAEPGAVCLAVYNRLGQRVRLLQDGIQQAGEGKAYWDGRDDYGKQVAAGVFYARLEFGSQRRNCKMVLLR